MPGLEGHTMRLSFSVLPLLAICVLLLLAAAKTARASGPEDEAALRRLIADGEAAANRGDDPGNAVNIDPDVMFTNIFGTVFRGRSEWVERHRFLQTVLFKGAKLKQEIRRIYFVRPDVALVLVESEVSGIKNLPPGTSMTPDGTLRTLGLSVFTKEGDRWMMAAWHNTDVKPVPAGP
jgi:uncharacterized protein (TIGR02246 family)